MSKESQKMTARILTAAFTASVCLLVGASSAFGAAPVLKLTASSQPTNFSPGEEASEESFLINASPQYSIVVTNVGSAPTSGPITFTDTLPVSVIPVAAVARDVGHVYGGLAPGAPSPFVCSVSGQTVSCTEPFPLQPGEWAQFLIPVEVAEDALPSVINEARVEGGGAAEARATTTTTISSTLPSYDFTSGPWGFSVAATGTDGAAATQAGSHPYQLTVDLGFPTRQREGQGAASTLFSAGHLRYVKGILPRGMVANPNTIPVRCTEAELVRSEKQGLPGCPAASAIGIVTVTTNLNAVLPIVRPLYNMVPPPGVAAEFGFDASGAGTFTHLMGGVNSAGEYELGSSASEILAREQNPVFGTQVQLWGNPSDVVHDAMRGDCTGRSEPCPVARISTPFLTMPTSCGPSLEMTAHTTDWEEPQVHSRTVQVEDPLDNSPTATDGCNKLDFDPSIEAKPTTNLSDSPSGLEFNLHVPQTNDFNTLATANFKDVKVTLPEGMTVNPSSANAQQACSSAQIGLLSAIGQSPVRFNEVPASCPDGAKIGSVEVSTPLLDHHLLGSAYLAAPFDNPFNSLLAIYLDVEDPATGVVAKLAGEVQADPNTGRLTTLFSENPELPIEDVKLSLFKGPRAPLATPIACGTHSTAAQITPWSSPEGIDAQLSDSFETQVAASGSGACPTSEAAAPNNPALTVGTIAPQAASYSPLLFKLTRQDGSQRITGIDTTLPKGLIARLAGIPYCSDAAIAQAQSRNRPNEGALEQASPSCPAASEVGQVSVGAGTGITPFYASGHVYLAGPYKGGPLSLVTITPVLAGPFDLGTVAVRVALRVDPETAKVQAISDPLPRILDGIPADIRSIALTMNRPDFTLNPTSCDPMQTSGNATSALGSIAPLSSPFQVGGCQALGFKPKLAIALKGGTKRASHPALKATLTYPKGAYANIAKAQVTLPKSEFLDQGHIQTICTRVQFAAKQCPAGAVYGYAKAITPLLDAPVQGPVYLRSSSHELPDLVADLNGQINVVLDGRIDTVGRGIRTTFEAVPDAPVSKFILEMKGAKKGLLVNSTNLCKQTNRATALFDGQNGKTYDTKPVVSNSCKAKAKKKAHKGHKGKSHR